MSLYIYESQKLCNAEFMNDKNKRIIDKKMIKNVWLWN